ncbi:unnamed protein product [Moneuplotes crassus]|uniref:Uncharacterized protein n=1 Tax=Euplotes crassus TaxID=5936 RepID=A0AAD1XQL0_EUPCR|nr:unnamed protein product [Moneuplotes crassus]
MTHCDEVRFFFDDAQLHASDKTYDLSILGHNDNSGYNFSEITCSPFPEIYECDQNSSDVKVDNLQKYDQGEDFGLDFLLNPSPEKSEAVIKDTKTDTAEGDQLLNSVKIEDDQEAWDNIMRTKTRRFNSSARDKVLNENASESSLMNKRWGLQEDKNLCKVIKDLENRGILDLQKVLNLGIIKDSSLHPELELLAEMLKWRNPLRTLVSRIKKLYSRGYSKREIKRLKKKLKSFQGVEDIDYEALLYDFPGKTMKDFVPLCESLTRCIWNKTLSKFELADRV